MDAMAVASEEGLRPEANAALKLKQDQVKAGTAISYSSDTGIFTLAENGLYEIHYHSSCGIASSFKAPITVGLHLTNGGIPIPGTLSASTIKEISDTLFLSGAAIVNVTSTPANIALVASSAGGSYGSTLVMIRKLD